jgi:hypothetical protein
MNPEDRARAKARFTAQLDAAHSCPAAPAGPWCRACTEAVARAAGLFASITLRQARDQARRAGR